ncbi:SDR family oxidoreductase [Rhodoplanes sp. SY1]|uniref:SDR family oxidoreductase n=1 Tax=Rhodoplanes sp. SY1 TaxID=3166646 RepID=UPI0038B531DC
MPQPPSAPGKAALVTGGAQRIGRAIVRALVRNGYAVAIHARGSAGEADALCAEIAAAGGVARPVVADLADHAAVLRLVPAAVAAVGPLTLLVNNASTFERDEIGGLDRALFDLHMAVNLRAPVFLAEAFAGQAPGGETPGGPDPSVVNIVDQRVYKPTPRFLSYGLSKSALHTATTTLAQALAPAVRVNAVAPGPTLPSPRQDADSFARQAAAVPLGRGPSPEEIADAVLYLARARSVTGETIAVDGGQRLAWQTPDAVGVEE